MKYLLYLFALPALAQFSGLTTTPDGSTLYFTSTLRQHNTTQPLHGKIFSLDDREMKPVLVIPEERISERYSNFFDLATPYLDERGQLAGTYGNRRCFSVSCRDFDGSSYGGATYGGRLILSPNRRYALQIIWTSLSTYTHTLLDLANNQVLATAAEFSTTPAIVTNTGIAWRATGSAIQRLSPGDTNFQTIFRADQGTSFTALNTRRDTDHLLVLRIAPSLTATDILELDPNTRAEMKIASTVPDYCISIAEVRAQSLVAHCQNPQTSQLLRFDLGASFWQQISLPSAFIKDWTLSSDGSTIWYLTRANAFHKLSLQTQTDETRLPPTGALFPNQANASPGSLFFVEGEDIDDYRLQFTTPNAPPIHLNPVARSASLLTFQIPSDLLTNTSGASFRAISDRPSLFEMVQPITANLLPLDPAFFTLSSTTGNIVPSKAASQPIAARQDFSALITQATPARSQEVIHFWATNLGPASPSSGSITTPGFACFAGGSTTPLELLYAGLAPSMPGIYQVTLRLPAFDSTPGSMQLNCGFPGLFNAFIVLPIA